MKLSLSRPALQFCNKVAHRNCCLQLQRVTKIFGAFDEIPNPSTDQLGSDLALCVTRIAGLTGGRYTLDVMCNFDVAWLDVFEFGLRWQDWQLERANEQANESGDSSLRCRKNLVNHIEASAASETNFPLHSQ
jgi:hypothetical protein